MTVNDYILQKFQTFGVNLSEADLFDICLNAKISGGGEMNEDCQTRVSVAIAKFIPSLLLRATSISESGFSMSWNIQGINEEIDRYLDVRRPFEFARYYGKI